MTVTVRVDRVVIDDGWSSTTAQLREQLASRLELDLAGVPVSQLAQTATATVTDFFGGAE